MDLETITGIAAGILTAVSAIPQIVKVINTKNVEHIAPFMFIVLLCGNGLWVYYGIMRSDLPIIITNAFSSLMDLIMLVLKVKYSGKRS